MDDRLQISADDLRSMERGSARKLFGAFEPVEVGGGYYAAATLVAVLMLLLPLIYLAFVGVVGWGVWWHMIENVPSGGVDGRRSRGEMLVYVAPIIAGIVAVFFLIKPIFAPRGRHMRPYSIERHEAPRLYEIVDQLCDTIGSPRPKRIDVSCDANASASFRRGFLSMAGNDLVLTVGLPLVGAMRTNEFIGVVAHEFGHFTQGGAMRLTYFIGRVNGWFARVVYQRDRWDERLEQWAREGGVSWAGLIMIFCRLCVWVSRRVLWVLMHIGAAFSSLLSRQMEHDADLHEIRVVGSAAFARTFVKLECLGLAQAGAFMVGQANSRTGVLAEDIPAHIVGLFRSIPREKVEELKQGIYGRKTGLFDTHPSTAARLERAKAENAAGIFADDSRASDLFMNYPMVCRAATEIFYKDMLGPYAEGARRVPWTELATKRGGRAKEAERADIPLAESRAR